MLHHAFFSTTVEYNGSCTSTLDAFFSFRVVAAAVPLQLLLDSRFKPSNLFFLTIVVLVGSGRWWWIQQRSLCWEARWCDHVIICLQCAMCDGWHPRPQSYRGVQSGWRSKPRFRFDYFEYRFGYCFGIFTARVTKSQHPKWRAIYLSFY